MPSTRILCGNQFHFTNLENALENLLVCSITLKLSLKKYKKSTNYILVKFTTVVCFFLSNVSCDATCNESKMRYRIIFLLIVLHLLDWTNMKTRRRWHTAWYTYDRYIFYKSQQHAGTRLLTIVVVVGRVLSAQPLIHIYLLTIKKNSS